MRFAITGSAGFIGSHLTDVLIENGHDVIGIDNFETGRRENVNIKSEFIEGSISSVNNCAKLFSFKPDVLIHCAASYKDPNNYTLDTHANILGGVNLIVEAQNRSISRFVYFQTALVYGKAQEQPITLNHPIAPRVSYAISKNVTELYLAISKLNYVTFRLANCYGPRSLTGPVSVFIQRLMKNQKCFVVNTRRDFIYIDDLVNIVTMAVDKNKPQFNLTGPYHISSGKDYSIQELYDEISKNLNSDLIPEQRERLDDDEPSILIDPSKTIKDFNYKVEIPLSYGIERTVKWYQENKVIGGGYTHLKM